MGGVGRWLVKGSWLGKLVSVFWWVELDFFSLECNEVSSSEFVQVSCQGFLVREACVHVLVGGAVFLLSGVQFHS